MINGTSTTTSTPTSTSPTGSAPVLTARQRAQEKQKARQKALRAAMRQMVAEAGSKMGGGGATSRVAEYTELLIAGKTSAGKVLSMKQTIGYVVKLIKAQAPVPGEVAGRFPWSAVSRATIEAIATAEHCDPDALARAIGIGSAALVDVDGAAETETPPPARARRR